MLCLTLPFSAWARGTRSSLDSQDRAALSQQAVHEGLPIGSDGRPVVIAPSAGGSDGTFSSGLIKGWTEVGPRPDIEV